MRALKIVKLLFFFFFLLQSDSENIPGLHLMQCSQTQGDSDFAFHSLCMGERNFTLF